MSCLKKKDIYKLVSDKGVSQTREHVIEVLKNQQLPLPSEKAINKSINKIKDQYVKLNKSKTRPSYISLLQKLDDEDYQLPKPNVKSHPKKPILVQSGRYEHNVAESIYHSSLVLGSEVQKLSAANEKLECENKLKRSLEIETKQMSKKLKTLEADQIRLKTQHENQLKKVEERFVIEKQERILNLQTRNNNLKKQNSFLKSKEQHKQLSLKRSQLRSTYFQSKCNELKRKLRIENDKVVDLNNEIKRLSDNIDTKEQIITG